ncbi:hypothetical protein FRB91_010227 [Serendipita sp. 411]|nr:hypothetical protein FRC16_010420 [Serendipita sp. 398]KAG8849115.1 hypothetical protein FRB91_010227 [Serendipita sp. 411]
MLILTILIWFPSYIFALHLLFKRVQMELSNEYEINQSFSLGTSTGSGPGGWLARLGWGLGEASVEIMESNPSQIYEARVAFFGSSIPEDGLIGWLIPLDTIVGPCPTEPNSTTPDPTALLETPPPDRIPVPFMAMDPSYEFDMVYEYEEPLPDDSDTPPVVIDNPGCPPLCPLPAFRSLVHGSPHSESLTGIEGDVDLGDEELPFVPFPNTSWVALVQRGSCSFAAKAQYAQSLGASALIVGGFDETLISMSAGGIGAGQGIEISNIFIGRSAYVNLTKAIEESNVRLRVGDGSHELEKSMQVESQHEHGKSVEGAVISREVKTILVRLEGEPAWEWYTPILSLLIILSLPSLLTLCTLFIHRIRAERREREMRAPEDIVAGLPIRVWTGSGWEKDLERGRQGTDRRLDESGGNGDPSSERTPLLQIRSDSKEDDRPKLSSSYGAMTENEASTSAPRQTAALPYRPDDTDKASPGDQPQMHPSVHPSLAVPEELPSSSGFAMKSRSSRGGQHRAEESDETIPRPPWFASQSECAICLCDFEVGDKVRVLPCGHIFHMDEVDPWLIKQKKLCPVCKYDVTNPPTALVPATESPALSTALASEVQQGPAESHSSSPSSNSGIGVRPSVYAVEDRGENPDGQQSSESVVSALHNEAAQSRSGAIIQPHDVTAAQMLANVDDMDRHRVRTNGSILSRVFGTRHWLLGRAPPNNPDVDAALQEERVEHRDEL